MATPPLANTLQRRDRQGAFGSREKERSPTVASLIVSTKTIPAVVHFAGDCCWLREFCCEFIKLPFPRIDAGSILITQSIHRYFSDE